MLKLFVLSQSKVDQSRGETDYVRIEPIMLGPPLVCPVCGQMVSGRVWLDPHRVELRRWGRRFGDIVFGPGDHLLVSERFVNAWAQSRLTGLTGFDPVEIVKVTRRGEGEDIPPAYWHVEAVRSKAAIDEQRSGIEWDGDQTVCRECRFRGDDCEIIRLDRVILEPEPLPTEDLFYPRGLWGVLLASDRFAEFCLQHQFLNALLIPAEDFSFRYDHLRRR